MARAAKPLRGLSAALALAAHVGCGEGDENTGKDSGQSSGSAGEEIVPPGILCDGSGGLRMAALNNDGGFLSVPFMTELGARYLYVRGDCHYWTLPRSPFLWDDVHEGVLDSATESQIATDLLFTDWSEMSGSYSGAGGYDVGSFLFSDGTHSIRCEDSCDTVEGDAPDGVIGLSSAANYWWTRLWESGAPMTGPVRVLLTYTPGEEWFEHSCLEEWPFSWDPQTVAVPRGELEWTVGESVLADNADIANDLRAYRATRRDIEGPCQLGVTIDWVAFVHEGTLYELWMRDAIPLENERGLIPKPLPR